LSIDNFRSFPSISSLHLGRINVFTGKNNSGKSSIIKALHLLQSDGGDGEECVRTGSKTARIALVLEDVFSITAWDPHGDSGHAFATIALGNGTSARQFRLSSQNGSANVSQFPNVEPFHFVVPFLSKRKAVAFMEDVRRQNTLQVSSDMSFLSAKLSQLSWARFVYRVLQAHIGFCVIYSAIRKWTKTRDLSPGWLFFAY
jgi:energy-coupling factor transporter ATP-binding protein EcfA2